MGSHLNREKFAETIMSRRHAKELTLRQVAKEAGVSASTLSRIERGDAENISLETFFQMCDWLEVDPKSFIVSESDQAPEPIQNVDRIITLLRVSDIMPADLARAVAEFIAVVAKQRELWEPENSMDNGD